VSDKEISFLIPWHALCSDNRKYLSGKFVLSSQYRKAKALVGHLARLAARKTGWPRSTDALELVVIITPPDNRYRDLNFSKNLKDGISATQSVWVDDCQVRREVWEFVPEPDKARPGAVITIRPYQPSTEAPLHD
jgi:hypothetical protein